MEKEISGEQACFCVGFALGTLLNIAIIAAVKYFNLGC